METSSFGSFRRFEKPCRNWFLTKVVLNPEESALKDEDAGREVQSHKRRAQYSGCCLQSTISCPIFTLPGRG